MVVAEHTSRLLARISAIGQAADEAAAAVEALTGSDLDPEVARWLPAIKQALSRIQLDCAEIRFATRELREACRRPAYSSRACFSCSTDRRSLPPTSPP